MCLDAAAVSCQTIAHMFFPQDTFTGRERLGCRPGSEGSLGVKIVYVLPFSLKREGNTQIKFTQQNDGTISGQSWDNAGTPTLVLLSSPKFANLTFFGLVRWNYFGKVKTGARKRVKPQI